MNSLSLLKLNSYIKRVIQLNFQDSIWVHAEISNVQNRRGHYYFEFVEHDAETLVNVAKATGIMWSQSFKAFEAKFPDYSALLTIGHQVLFKCNVGFDEKYGMKLTISEFDPYYTIGNLQETKLKTLQILSQKAWFEQNKKKVFPSVIQKIGVISSENAAGYIDFCHQLNSNKFGYKFKIDLFSTAMQGENTENEVVNSLEAIHQQIIKYDIITIIRGGGSKLDLFAFDSIKIAEAICKSELAVLTGIGHEIDNTIADIVAHSSLKTPTALAEFIIQHNFLFENTILNITTSMLSDAKALTQSHQNHLNSLKFSLIPTTKSKILIEKYNLTAISKSIKDQYSYKINQSKNDLSLIESIINANHPERILKKGYAIISQNGQIITSKSSYDSNTSNVQIEWIDGRIDLKTS